MGQKKRRGLASGTSASGWGSHPGKGASWQGTEECADEEVGLEPVWNGWGPGGELVLEGLQSLVLTGAWALQKAESEELEVQKPQVKLRRTVSEVARPASTPPIMASAIKDEDDEDRIIAELEVGQGHAWLPKSSARPLLSCPPS